MFHALLDSGTEVLLIHTRVYNSQKEKSKLKKQSAFPQSVGGEPIDVDGCASLRYDIGREKQEHAFFVVSEMKGNIIFGSDWLKQFGVHMYYDLGSIRIGKSHVKMEEDIHTSSLARLTAHTIIRLQTRKFCLCISKGNDQWLISKFHHIIPTEDSTIYREPGLLTVNSIVKTSKQGNFSVFLISNTNKVIWLRKGSTTGKEVKECNFVNINDLNQWE